MDEGTEWTWTTKQDVDEVAVVFAWLGGLYDIDSSGVDKANLHCTVEYSEDDGSTWTAVRPDSKSDWYHSAKKPDRWQASGTTQGVKRKILRLEWATKATRTIRAQSVILPGDLTMADGDISGAADELSQVVGQEARIAIYAGRPVRLKDVGPPAVIERNEVVPLVFQKNGLQITAEGRSLSRR